MDIVFGEDPVSMVIEQAPRSRASTVRIPAGIK
jgi:hypothetical protein